MTKNKPRKSEADLLQNSLEYFAANAELVFRSSFYCGISHIQGSSPEAGLRENGRAFAESKSL
ncbi:MULTISPECIES: hypothetical protein [unclassified Fibrobacter]|uniref:hypothetical protein n=1 Tax=unclassified Fibrobacter TaxID=2634177 RepID=UPI0020163AC5|nr:MULTISPECIES: hypothetical protein [Fibrobacter]